MKLYLIDAALLAKHIEAGEALDDCIKEIGTVVSMPKMPSFESTEPPRPYISPSVTFQIRATPTINPALINQKCSSCCHFQRFPAMCRRTKRRINPNNPCCPKFGPLSSTPNRKRK